MSYFKNQVIWLTGASSGIGESLVYELAKQGAKIIISARRTEELERVKQQAQSADIYVLPLDLAKPETFAEKTQEAIKAFGHVDMLFHNGGISQRSYIKDTEEKVYRQIMEVNYFGTVSLTRAILPHFEQRKKGHFVVVTSVLGKVGTPMRGAYASSKHALHGFFDCLRAEYWKENILVTMICPGFIRTNVAINALTATGDKFNTMGENTGNGYPPDKCAGQILKAVQKKKYEAYVGKKFGKEHLGLYLRRLFPTIFANMARHNAPK